MHNNNNVCTTYNIYLYRMSGFGSSLQLQEIANGIRSSLNADAKQTFIDRNGNSQQRRLLASNDQPTDDSDTTSDDSSDNNSITKFAKALGKMIDYHNNYERHPIIGHAYTLLHVMYPLMIVVCCVVLCQIYIL
jgi:hypothetical protein